jgi:hypothetical protein
MEIIVRKSVGVLLAVAGLLPGVLGLSPAAAAARHDSVHVFLTGSVAFSASNAWAVGWGGVDSATADAFSEHWNGTKWVRVSTVNYGTTINGLEGLSATGPADMWGVGWLFGNCLIQHYNGTKWANVACPYAGLESQLNAVSARTRSDAWAVGWVTPNASQLGFSEHWNGTKWSEVKTAPVSGSFIQFSSVLDLGPKNVFAVGYYETKSGGTFVKHEMAQHWNGQAWQKVSVPGFSGASFLAGVSGGTSSGVIAVGAVSAGGHEVPLIERWNGTKFVRVTQPVSAGDLAAVTVLSSSNAYAAGETGSGRTLVEHFNGTKWAQVSTPNPADGGFFASVAATPSGSFVDAAGWHGADPNEVGLIEQGNGRTWKITHQ